MYMQLSLKNQTDILVLYLTGRSVSDPIIYELYEHAVEGLTNDKEGKLLKLAFNRPFIIPYLDGGLVFIRSTSELRRRIYIIFSILESSPDYSDLFIPKKYTLTGTILIGLSCIRAALRAAIGIVIIKLGRL